MGSMFQVVVDRDATPDEAANLGVAIRDWLISEQVIEACPNQDCVLGSEVGYPPGPNCAVILAGPQDPWFPRVHPNGLKIITRPSVFDAGEFGPVVVCRQCRARSEGGKPWSEAVGQWYQRRGAGLVTCRSCGHIEPVIEWGYDPPCGFGELGFEFWNWPLLSELFVTKVGRRLGHRAVRVAGMV